MRICVEGNRVLGPRSRPRSENTERGGQRTALYDRRVLCRRAHVTLDAQAWAQGWGPDFYRISVTRRISHRARLAWQREREAEAAAERDGGTGK